ncbi:MAG TPA: hypothetical protein VII05_02705 [Gaiellaceae bacterium]
MEEKKVTFDAAKLREQFEKLRAFNSEFLVYIGALVVAMIVIAISDVLTITSWFEFYLVSTAAYILSRGIAKAHNVNE